MELKHTVSLMYERMIKFVLKRYSFHFCYFLLVNNNCFGWNLPGEISVGSFFTHLFTEAKILIYVNNLFLTFKNIFYEN